MHADIFREGLAGRDGYLLGECLKSLNRGFQCVWARRDVLHFILALLVGVGDNGRQSGRACSQLDGHPADGKVLPLGVHGCCRSLDGPGLRLGCKEPRSAEEGKKCYGYGCGESHARDTLPA